MKRYSIFPVNVMIMHLLLACAPSQEHEGVKTEFKFIESYRQIHLLVNEKHFTSYLFDTTLMKPVLYPVCSPSEIQVQRQFPLRRVKGESKDHSHHVGVFFTYGSKGEVNGHNFWAGQKGKTRINHEQVLKKEIQANQATLQTRSNWIGKEGDVVLVEDRTMIFSGDQSERAIDFTFSMKAQEEPVVFEDTKEGLFAIRVADWLNEKDGTGTYLNSRGEKTAQQVWGKRAKWIRLEGEHNGKTIGIIIMNHPSSVNYPTYWHARDYGLLSADPLGQYVFQKARGMEDSEPLNHEIPAGDSGLFKFKMIIYEGERRADQINKAFEDYAS